jgi:alkaline phosphatase
VRRRGSALFVSLVIVALIASVAGGSAIAQDATPAATSTGKAKNVIMFLGDGMGDSEITIARNYYYGADGRLWMDTLPATGEYTTYALQEDRPDLPDYVTDSAASGTGWSTGSKTSNGRISTIAGTDQTLTTILELAQQAGMLTGDVSTAEITDATPAVLASHVNVRGCQGPEDMDPCPQYKKSAGGPGSIAEQEVDHGVNVLLGGGKGRFDQTIDGGADAGKTVVESAEGQGYTVVTDASGLDGIQPGQNVLGLFNDGNMSLEWSGDIAAPEPGTGPQRCQEDQRPDNEPSLSAMTTKALDLLSTNDDKGFFLQVEGASIDKQDHAANICGQIGETIAFDNAIKVGLDFAASHPDTLIIVTADHAHTSQIIPTDVVSPGLVSTLITADGALMKVNYGTDANFEEIDQSHTGSEVRIAAQGPGSEAIHGILNQTDLFFVFADTLGLTPSQTSIPAGSPGATPAPNDNPQATPVS